MEEVNCHHNYTVREQHFGKDVWLSRKGAIDAAEGVRGLIPGSMGAASYVVTGKGNRLALNSSPHGAGRNHSRSAAKRLFTRDDLDARMEGIAWGDSDAFLDEHPEAYKPIDPVMARRGRPGRASTTPFARSSTSRATSRSGTGPVIPVMTGPFAGRDGRDAMLNLCDGEGRPRLRLRVTAEGDAAIELLGQDGEIVQALRP